MGRTTNQTMRRGKRILAAAAWVLAAGVLSASGQGGADKQPELWLGGQANAPLKIEVFSDFQCPVCRAFYLETMKPLIADFTKEKRIDKIYIVYHDFPLDMHQYARKAACYAMAAARLGRDPWLRVTDALYQEQAQWSQDGNIDAIVTKVLDPTELTRVKKLATDPSVEEAVRLEVLLGQGHEVTMTPTFFIITQAGHQEKVPGGVPYALLKGRLEQLLKQ
jgi:protein-disulfide isomerase